LSSEVKIRRKPSRRFSSVRKLAWYATSKKRFSCLSVGSSVVWILSGLACSGHAVFSFVRRSRG
jgi:hypothetical protein